MTAALVTGGGTRLGRDMSIYLGRRGAVHFNSSATAAEEVAVEFRGAGRRAAAIGPGPTVQGVRQSEAHFAKQRAGTVLGRGANAEDILAAVGFLIDSPAVMKQLLCVDGGQHLGWQTPDIVGASPR